MCRAGGGSPGHPAAASCKSSPSSGGRAQSPSFSSSMAENIICAESGDPPPTTTVSPIGCLTASWRGSRTFLIIIHRAKAFWWCSEWEAWAFSKADVIVILVNESARSFRAFKGPGNVEWAWMWPIKMLGFASKFVAVV